LGSFEALLVNLGETKNLPHPTAEDRDRKSVGGQSADCAEASGGTTLLSFLKKPRSVTLQKGMKGEPGTSQRKACGECEIYPGERRCTCQYTRRGGVNLHLIAKRIRKRGSSSQGAVTASDAHLGQENLR